MKVITGILSCILLLNFKADAQNGNYNLGARSMGISNTSITISDAFASFNNIGALASQNNLSAYFSSSILYGIPGLLIVGAGLNRALLKGTATINFFRFGDDLFNEHKIGLGYSHKIRFISLGLQVNYIQYNIQGYGSSAVISFEFGGVIEICPELLLGAYIFNPTQSDPFHEQSNFLPTILKAGISYKPAENLMINAEYHSCLFLNQYWIFGMEYLIREKVALRTGITLDTFRSTFGVGVKPGKLEINYAIDIHPILGISHEFSLTINIRGK
jgi:hypothetical protein